MLDTEANGVYKIQNVEHTTIKSRRQSLRIVLYLKCFKNSKHCISHWLIMKCLTCLDSSWMLLSNKLPIRASLSFKPFISEAFPLSTTYIKQKIPCFGVVMVDFRSCFIITDIKQLQHWWQLLSQHHTFQNTRYIIWNIECILLR